MSLCALCILYDFVLIRIQRSATDPTDGTGGNSLEGKFKFENSKQTEQKLIQQQKPKMFIFWADIFAKARAK